MPDEALRNGDFSKAFNTNGSQQVIYNPFTGNPDGTGRQPFPNNQIPASMINPIAKKILNMYPRPNTQGIGAGGYTNNFQRQEDRQVDRQNYDGKVNWNRTSTHQLWAKFSHMHAVVDDLSNYLGVPTVKGSGGLTNVYQLTAGQTWTLSPTLLMDQTFGFSMQKQDVLGPDFNAGNFGLDVLGIPGTNDQGIGDQRYAGYPEFRFGGTTSGFFSQLGNRDGWNPIFRDERTYSIATNITKVKGRHDFRGGYFLNFLYLDHWQPETGNPRGRFDFNVEHDRAARRPDAKLLQRLRGVSARPGQVGQQEPPERADDVARVAARPLLPRSVDADAEADPGSRAAVGVLSRSCIAPTGAASTGWISRTRPSRASSTSSSPDEVRTRRPTA